MSLTIHPQFRRLLYLLLVPMFLLTGCDKNPFSNKISEGIIVYKIDYPEIDPDNVMLELMPKKMEMIFKGNDFRNDIIAGMGLFRTSIISESSKNELIHSVKMLDKRYYSALDESDIETMNPRLNDIKLEYTGNEKEIAGIVCKEVIVIQDGATLFKLYFTDKIGIESPNRGTPFKDIPGVLMEYEIINYDTHMHFQAEEVLEIEIVEDELSLEDGYKEISPLKLKDEIQAIFDKVK